MQSGDPFSSLSGIGPRASAGGEPFPGASPPQQQQQQGGMDSMPPGGGYGGAPMMRQGGPASDEEARRGAMSLQANLERMQKKYNDDILRVLEAVTIRLERLETTQERSTAALSELKTSVSELKQTTEAAYRSVSDRAGEFEATLGTAAAGVQALRDKQVLIEEQQRLAESTLAEAHAELARVKDVARSVAKEVVREVQEQARQQAPEAPEAAPAAASEAAAAPAAPQQQLPPQPQPPSSPELGHAYGAQQQPPPGAYSPQPPQVPYANAPPPAPAGYAPPAPPFAPFPSPPPAPPPPAAPYPPMPMYPPPQGGPMYGVPGGIHGEMHPPPPPQMLATPPPPMDYYGAPPPPPPQQHGHAPSYHYAPPPPPPPPRGAPPTPPAQLATSKVPIEKVIDDLSAMGFTRDEVRGVIRSLTENGQSVELNVVIDRLMNGSSEAAQRNRAAGWFGR